MKSTRRIRRRRMVNRSVSHNLQKKENEHTKDQIQTKLSIGKPGDKYEQEADAVAEKVVSNTNANVQKLEEEEGVQTKPLSDMITPMVQKQIEEEEEPVQTFLQRQIEEEEEEPVQTKMQLQPEEEEEEIQTKLQPKSETEKGEGERYTKSGLSDKNSTAPAWVTQEISNKSDWGRSLTDDTKSFMESRIGADFKNVRIHDNDKSAQMNQELHAQAFTTGNDIYFNRGKYNPDSTSGKKLLAHELTHVVQQGHAKSVQSKLIQRQGKPYWKKGEEKFKRLVLSLDPKKPKSNAVKFKSAVEKTLGIFGKKKTTDKLFTKLKINPKGKKILSLIGMGSYGLFMLSKKKIPGLSHDFKLKDNMWLNVTTGGDFKKPKIMIGLKVKF